MTATKMVPLPPQKNHGFNVKHESMGASSLEQLKDIYVIHEQRIIQTLPLDLFCISATFMPIVGCFIYTLVLSVPNSAPTSTTSSNKTFTFSLLLIFLQSLKDVQRPAQCLEHSRRSIKGYGQTEWVMNECERTKNIETKTKCRKLKDFTDSNMTSYIKANILHFSSIFFPVLLTHHAV